jgi:very-short-patch-repair endonuclease
MKKPKPKKQTLQQVLLCIHLKELGFETVTELQFCEGRRWRFDIACPDERLAFEVSGGNWTGGHKRGLEQESEYDKLNTAQMLGWRVLQYTNRQVTSGEARDFVKKHLRQPPNEDVPIEQWGMVR